MTSKCRNIDLLYRYFKLKFRNVNNLNNKYFFIILSTCILSTWN